MDCGRNIYESDAEYLSYLKQRLIEQDSKNSEIEQLEAKLGIKHPGNSSKKNPTGPEYPSPENWDDWNYG